MLGWCKGGQDLAVLSLLDNHGFIHLSVDVSSPFSLSEMLASVFYNDESMGCNFHENDGLCCEY